MAKIVSIKNNSLDNFLGFIRFFDGERERFESERSVLTKTLLQTKDDAEIKRLKESIVEINIKINALKNLRIELVKIVHDIDEDYKI